MGPLRTDVVHKDCAVEKRHIVWARGDLVRIETWFQEEGRVSACRNWIIQNQSTGEEIGRATR